MINRSISSREVAVKSGGTIIGALVAVMSFSIFDYCSMYLLAYVRYTEEVLPIVGSVTGALLSFIMLSTAGAIGGGIARYVGGRPTWLGAAAIGVGVSAYVLWGSFKAGELQRAAPILLPIPFVISAVAVTLGARLGHRPVLRSLGK